MAITKVPRATNGPDTVLGAGTTFSFTFNGLGGDDIIFGGNGNDTLDGGPGNDIVDGRKGNDTLIYTPSENVGNVDYYDGGQGKDTLVLNVTQAEFQSAAFQKDIAAFNTFLVAHNNVNSLTVTLPFINVDLYKLTFSTPFFGAVFHFTDFNLYVRNVEVLKINILNTPPVAQNDTAVTNEDTSVIINVLSNDSDIDHNTLTVTSVTQGLHGSVAINSNQTLTYTPAANFNGSDSFTYKISDGQGGTATATVGVTVNPVNDVPSFSLIANPNQTVNEDSGLHTLQIATNILAGPPDEAGQALNFIVASDNPGLFSTAPTIAPNGTLAYQSAPDANGVAHITVALHDNGGTANGGVDTSATQTFTITVLPVNDAPTFDLVANPNQIVNEDSGLHTVQIATNISAGPPDESGQALNFIFTIDNPGLFSVGPTIAPDGTLTYQSAPDANGVANIAVALCDNGGTANGGVDTSTIKNFSITVNLVNEAPSFNLIANPDQTTNEDTGLHTVQIATNISAGPPDESGQALNFIVTTDNPSLFSAGPGITSSGQLIYVPAPNANGVAHVSVALHDDGGTANGGVDTSAPQTFTITVNPVNDAPSFNLKANPNQVFNEDQFASVTVLNFAQNISAGPPDESGQTLNFIVTNDNPSLFAVAPSILPNGDMSFSAAPNAFGVATVSVSLHDNGGTANGGVDTSGIQTFTITINPVNDAPSFNLIQNPDQTVNEDSGLHTVQIATNILAGPPNESGQALNFIVSTDNPSLFSVLPTISPTGVLTCQSAPNASGDTSITVQLHDDGGTANGGLDTSQAQTFHIKVNPVNDPPSFTLGGVVQASGNSILQTIPNYISNISLGPANESAQHILNFSVTALDPSIFSIQPTIDLKSGELQFALAPNPPKFADVRVTLQDDGGTANGGIDTTSQDFIINIHQLVPTTLTLLATDDFASETNSDPAVFTITRSNIDTFNDTIIPYTIGGTATNGTDYNSISGIAIIPVGQTSTTITVVPIDDTIVEPNETVKISLTGPGVTNHPGTVDAINIQDNDGVNLVGTLVSVYATTGSVAEGGTAPGVFTFTRSNINGDLAVHFDLSGTATDGTRYTIDSPNNFIIFASGSNTATLNVSAIDDTLPEPLQSITLTIKNDPAYETLSLNNHDTINLVDNDGLAIATTVSVVASDPIATESGDQGSFTFTRANADLSTDLTVHYTISGTASNFTPEPSGPITPPPADYQFLSGTVTIPAGSASAIVPMIPIDDNIADPNETVIVTLTPDVAYGLTSASQATVHIVDNDLGTLVSVYATTASLIEGLRGAEGVFTLTRSDTAGDLTVNYTLSGTAANGTDYVALPSANTVTFHAGSATATVDILSLNNQIPQDLRSITLTLGNSITYETSPLNNHDTINLVDDDSQAATPSVAVIVKGPQTIDPGTPGEFSVGRINAPLTADLTLHYTISGTAVNEAPVPTGVTPPTGDYQYLSGTVTILAGSDSAQIPVVPNNPIENTDKTITVTLTPDNAYQVIDTFASATLTIGQTTLGGSAAVGIDTTQTLNGLLTDPSHTHA